MQNPQRNPLSIPPRPACSVTPKPSRDPTAQGARGTPQTPQQRIFQGGFARQRVCLRFSPRLALAASLGRVFSTGFLFPLRTPRVCVALSPRHNAPLHFLGRGLARASDLSGAKSQGSRVTRGHRGQTKSLQPLM